MQNADDAGANEVVFVSDEREFDITGGGLEGTQGERHCGHWEENRMKPWGGTGWCWEGLGELELVRGSGMCWGH